MKNFKNYSNFILESTSKNYTYSIFTAVAIFSNFFDFLNEEENRYNMSDNSFWQSFIYTLKDLNMIHYNKEDLLSLKTISLREDWNKLKKCVKAAEKIEEYFSIINSVKITDNTIEITSEDNIANINGDSAKKIDDKRLLDFVGLDLNGIYDDVLFTVFISDYFNLTIKYLKNEYKEKLSTFLKELDETSWYNYNKVKLKNLGVRCNDMPELYYNKLNKFCEDLSDNKSCFIDYDSFYKEWLSLKENQLIRYLIINKINIDDKKLKSI